MKDDWEEAWRAAGELLDASKSVGIPVKVTVKPVVVSTGHKRARRAWGVFVITA